MSDSDSKSGVQSLEIGMQVLQAIVNGHRAMALKDIAAAAGMAPSKTHRYLVSLIRSGMVEQDSLTSRYELGPFAMTIGLVAADRLDRIRLGLDAIARLCAEIDEATALVAWSQNGPVVVRWERPKRSISISVTTASALDMVKTAGGRIFGAYLPPAAYDHLITKALKSSSLPKDLGSRSAIAALFSQTRQAGLARVEGDHLVPGVASLAAPVFNSKNDITLAIAVVGFQGMLDTRPEQAVALALKIAANDLSQKLGYRGDTSTSRGDTETPAAPRQRKSTRPNAAGRDDD